MHHLAEENYPGMTSRSVLTESILINGHGMFYNVRQSLITLKFFRLLKHQPSLNFNSALNFNYINNKKYRLQLTHTHSRHWPFSMSTLANVIASDSLMRDSTFAHFYYKLRIII